MRFACERCGKKYATAKEPAPGRLYKLECNACGHLIVVKVSASGAAPATTASAPAPAPAPIADAPPPLADAAAPDAPRADAPPPIPDAQAPATAEAADPPAEPGPPPAEPGYVDLFSDVSGLRELEPKPPGDAFAAAERASLPEPATPGAGATAFAAPRDEAAAPASPRAARPVPQVPVLPKPDTRRSSVPLLLIGAGVAVLVAILVFVLLSSRSAPPARAAAAAPSAPPLGPAPMAAAAPAALPVSVAQQPPASPAEPAAEPPAERDRGTRPVERRTRREDPARAEAPRSGRGARPADREPAPEPRLAAPAGKAPDAGAAADAEAGLTQAQIEGVLRSTKPAFDGCIHGAGGAGAGLDGRRVTLRLHIETSGAVTAPSLDDAALDRTELGTCLKGAARLMVFPRFGGEAVQVEVPLVIR